jgi:hypothetical protein
MLLFSNENMASSHLVLSQINFQNLVAMQPSPQTTMCLSNLTYSSIKRIDEESNEFFTQNLREDVWLLCHITQLLK